MCTLRQYVLISLYSSGQHAILGCVFSSLLSQNGGEGNDSLPCASFPETSGLEAKKKEKENIFRPHCETHRHTFCRQLKILRTLLDPILRNDWTKNPKVKPWIYSQLDRLGIISTIFVTNGRTEWSWPSCCYCTRGTAEQCQRVKKWKGRLTPPQIMDSLKKCWGVA